MNEIINSIAGSCGVAQQDISGKCALAHEHHRDTVLALWQSRQLLNKYGYKTLSFVAFLLHYRERTFTTRAELPTEDIKQMFYAAGLSTANYNL